MWTNRSPVARICVQVTCLTPMVGKKITGQKKRNRMRCLAADINTASIQRETNDTQIEAYQALNSF